jgi:hypothetical protein
MRVEPMAATSSPLLPGYLRLAAKITLETRRQDPEILWFDLPVIHAQELAPGGDAWLHCCLPLAYHLSERLVLSQPIDAELYENAGEMMRVWSVWDKSRAPVPIECDFSAGRSVPGRHTAAFFSGGVDSFFTALHHDQEMKKLNLPADRAIDDLIFVWGYDLPLAKPEAFERLSKKLARIAAGLGKQLVIAASNLRDTCCGNLDWGRYLFGAALGAVGLMLGGRYKKIMISSSDDYSIIYPWGSSPLLDHLMSSKQTRFFHYGAGFSRYQKTEFISQFKLALEHLHVCWMDASDENCGQCEKCYRTLITLDALGRLPEASSFPRLKYSMSQAKRIYLSEPFLAVYLREIVEGARRQERGDIVAALESCLTRNKLYRQIEQATRQFARIRGGGRLANWCCRQCRAVAFGQ